MFKCHKSFCPLYQDPSGNNVCIKMVHRQIMTLLSLTRRLCWRKQSKQNRGKSSSLLRGSVCLCIFVVSDQPQRLRLAPLFADEGNKRTSQRNRKHGDQDNRTHRHVIRPLVQVYDLSLLYTMGHKYRVNVAERIFRTHKLPAIVVIRPRYSGASFGSRYRRGSGSAVARRDRSRFFYAGRP